MNTLLGLALLTLSICVWEVNAKCKGAPMGDDYITGPEPKKKKYKKDDVITYTCKEGYHIQGEWKNVTEGTIYCKGKDWSGPRPCCVEIKPCPCNTSFWLEGPPSTIANDAPSDVYCPAGYYAGECLCKHEKTCDGVRFWDADITKCTATNTGYDGVTVAVTRCDMIQGKDIMTITVVVSDETTIVYCPPGYLMEACVLMDPWTPSRTNYIPKSAVGGVLGCKWETTSVFNYVLISARCCK